MIDRPRVSVVMPVYNASAYLRTAVKSILQQTSRDFEFIIVDDGSTDDSAEILNGYFDSRIRLIETTHIGLTAALNKGLAACRGEFIARMDADDIAAPERFALQVAYLEENPQIDILCSDADLIDERAVPIGRHRMGPVDRDHLSAAFSYKASYMPIIHPSVMMRRTVVETLGGYRDFTFAEDFDFWIRANAHFRFAAMARPLVAYRKHSDAVSRKRRALQATNGFMSSVCFWIREAEGVDIFEQRPDLFDRVAAEARRAIEDDLLVAEAQFHLARGQIRMRGLMRGSVALALALLGHGLGFLPSQRRRRMAALCEKLVHSTCLEIVRERGNASVSRMLAAR